MTDDSVHISGGSVTAGNIGGSHNRVRTGDVTGAAPTGEDTLTELRNLVAQLADQLSGAEQALTEELGAELAEPEPDAKRVHRLWDRIRGSLEVVKVGVDLAKIAESIAQLF